MSKRRCCREIEAIEPVTSCGVQGLGSNPICWLIVLVILQKTCLLENNNSFLLILLFLGFCFCSGGRGLGSFGY